MSAEVLSIAGICICAALCEQLMDKNRYQKVIRMVLGLQIAGLMIRTVSGIIRFAE